LFSNSKLERLVINALLIFLFFHIFITPSNLKIGLEVPKAATKKKEGGGGNLLFDKI